MPAPSDSLHAAAEEGEIDRLNQFLAAGEPVDSRDPEGRTPLMYAIHGRHADAVRHLLKWGAAVDAQTTGGATALHRAARGGDAEIVRLLLARGADPNQVVRPQRPPMRREDAEKMAAMQKRFGTRSDGPLTTVDSLIAESAKPLLPYRNGLKTLNAAIASGNLEVVTALLDAGADMVVTNAPTEEAMDYVAHGMSPLAFAVSQGETEIAHVLLGRGLDINGVHSASDKTYSLLRSAVMKGNVPMARLLLDAGADPNASEHEFMPPLRFAIHFGQAEMVALLLEYGADAVSRKPGPPLTFLGGNNPEIVALLERHWGTDWHHAVVSGDVATVRARLDAGATIDARNEKEQTALHIAAENDQAEIVRLLLERGVDRDAKSEFGQTPLMRAVLKGNRTVTRLLLESGADVDATNEWGRTALYSVRSEERRDIRNMLLHAGARVGLVEAAFLGNAARVRVLLESGTPVDSPNAGGMTALMASALFDDTALAILLHDTWGADPNARDARGETPLFYAARARAVEGDTTLMRHLLDWGANVDAENQRGETPLKDAILHSHDACMRLLLQRGADPNHPQGALNQAIRMAGLRGKDSTGVRILLEHGADANAPHTFNGAPRETPLIAALENCTTGVPARPDADAIEKMLPIIRLLIEHGADVQVATPLKNVLHLAIATGNVEIVRLVLDAGAPLEGDGIDALMLAQKYPKVTALLRRRGASEKEAVAAGLIPAGFLEGMGAIMRDIVEDPIARVQDIFARMRVEMEKSRRRPWSGSAAERE